MSQSSRCEGFSRLTLFRSRRLAGPIQLPQTVKAEESARLLPIFE